MRKKRTKPRSRVLAVMLAVTTTTWNAPYMMHGAVVHAEEAHAHEVHAETSGADEVEEIILVEGEPSEFGYVDAYFVDEDGNIVEPELIPEGNDQNTVFPEKYDLREEGLITAVRNQGRTGTCWSHGAMAAAESYLIATGQADSSINLSEAHLVYFGNCIADPDTNSPVYNDGVNYGYLGHYPEEGEGDDGYSKGGNPYRVYGALSAGMGIVSQPDTEDIRNYPSFDESRRYESEYILKNGNLYARDDIASIKNHLMTKGATNISYYAVSSNSSSEYYSADTKAYYAYDKTTTNHAVTLVGWDDNFSKENFATQPEGDGAWICKNSWGTYYGEDGFFYLSYYDPSYDRVYSVEADQTVGCYDNIYQYDGSTKGARRKSSTNTITGANIFTAEKNTTLEAVSVFTYEASIPYTIYIYKNDEEGAPMTGTLVHTQSSTMDYAGFHIVELDKSIAIQKGETFTVAIHYDKTGTYLMRDYYANSNGNSFYTSGLGTADSSWTSPTDCDVCIKAYTNDGILIDADNFPDANFRSYIVSYIDANKNGVLSDSEIAATTSIDAAGKNIYDLTGIAYFTELTTLNCNQNFLAYLNLEKNTKLTALYCANNIRTLDSVACTGFSVDNLDMTRVTSVSGAEITDGMFVPEPGASRISYQYSCSDGYLATFYIQLSAITHANVGTDGKCTDCGIQVYYAAVDSGGVVSYHTGLQEAIDSAAQKTSATVRLLSDVTGLFTVSKGDITFDNGDYTVNADTDTASSLTVNGGTVRIESGIYKANGGGALYVSSGTVSITGGEFLISENGGTSVSVADGIIDLLLPEGYVFYKHGTDIVAAGHSSNITELNQSVQAGLHTTHVYGSGADNKDGTHKTICSDCGVAKDTAHSMTAWTDNDNGAHVRSCTECSYSESANHVFSDWSDNGDGTHTHTCADCGAEETAKHSFGDWSDNGDGTNTRICADCGAKETAKHNFGDWSDNGDGTHSHICTDCGAKETVKHNFGDWSDHGDGTHIHSCTDCGSEETAKHNFGDWSDNGDGVHVHTCADCGAEETAKHNFGDWSDNGDGTHTHVCVECSVKETIDHEFNSWQQTDSEVHTRICADCLAEESGKHDISEWSNDESDNKHSRSCATCGWSEAEEHDMTEWTESEMDNGHLRFCETCGYYEFEEHNYGAWSDNGDGTHTRICETCSADETAEHSYNAWSDNGDSTHIHTCTDCGSEETAKHTLSEWTEVEADNGHMRYCDSCDYFEAESHDYSSKGTDNGDGTHNYICLTCQAVSETEYHTIDWYYEDPEVDAHVRFCLECDYTEFEAHHYDIWMNNGDGTHSRFCAECGAEEKAEHDFSSCSDDGDGTHIHLCADCGFEKITAHNPGAWFENEMGTHTRICIDCGSEDVAGHVFGDCSDNGDGTHIHICVDCGAEEKMEHYFGGWSDNGDGTYTHECENCNAIETCTPGDINDDGSINIFDLALLKSELRNGFTNRYSEIAADVNHDDMVDEIDLMLLQEYLVGIIRAF